MDCRIIAQFIGKIALIQGAVLGIPLLLAWAYGEAMGIVFLEAIALNWVVGGFFWQYGRKRMRTLNLREGIAITGLGWLAATILAMFPYYLSGFLGPLDSLFESISGFTGTGATVITDIEVLPQSLLLWRSMTHWLGGLGILVIFVALLPESGQFWSSMYQAEMTGPTRERILPRLGVMTRVLFFMYMGATAVAGIIFILCGMEWLSAVNHALSTVSAGGFSTYNASAAHFESVAVECWMTFFMVLTGGNFNLYFQIYKKGWAPLRHNTEFKAYVSILVVCTLLISLNLLAAFPISLGEALRYGSFQVASIATTGLVSADFDQWPSFSKLLLLLLMMMGGCAGSTATGLKISRVLILCRTLWALVEKSLHPRMVLDVRMNGKQLSMVTIRQVFQFFFLYIAFIFIWALLLISDGVSVFDAFGISISTMGCIGPAFGITGATETYAGLSAFSKGILCVSMLLGRLEMLTFLVMLKKDFWTSKSAW